LPGFDVTRVVNTSCHYAIQLLNKGYPNQGRSSMRGIMHYIYTRFGSFALGTAAASQVRRVGWICRYHEVGHLLTKASKYVTC